MIGKFVALFWVLAASVTTGYYGIDFASTSKDPFTWNIFILTGLIVMTVIAFFFRGKWVAHIAVALITVEGGLYILIAILKMFTTIRTTEVSLPYFAYALLAGIMVCIAITANSELGPKRSTTF